MIASTAARLSALPSRRSANNRLRTPSKHSRIAISMSLLLRKCR